VLAGALASQGHLERALRLVDQGLANATEERERLLVMAQQIRRQLVGPKLAGAVEAFKRGNYRLAQQEVEKLPREMRSIQVVEDFKDYLGQLIRRKQKAQALAPTGPFERVDALYFLLARKEVKQAEELLGRKDAPAAERVLTHALTFVPRFPFVNFLYAVSIYYSVIDRLTKQKDPDLDRLLSRLDSAASASQIAITDREIKQARELTVAIGRIRTMLGEVRQRRQALRREAALINPAIEEFNSIMESASGGIRSSDQLDEIHRRLVRLQGSMPELRRAAVSDAGKETVEQLDKVVLRNLDQVSHATEYQQCFQEFREIMESVKDGIRSVDQLRNVQRRFRDLRAKTTNVRQDARDRDARHALDQLAETLDRHLNDLDRHVNDFGRANRINELVEMFKTTMRELTQSGRLGHWEACQQMKRVRDLAKKERSQVSSKEDRQRLDELEQAATQVIRLLGC
jgi:hypothetical protein